MTNADTHMTAPTPNGRDSTVEKIQDKVADVAAQAKEHAESIRETVEVSARDGMQAVQKSAMQAQDSLADASQSVAKAVQRNPGLALAGALGVGVLVGLAVSRRN